MSRLVVGVALALVACGPGLRPPDAHETARTSLSNTGDPATFIALLHDSVTLGPLIFDDAACAAAFPPGDVGAAKFDALSRCLAGLHLRPSPREDDLGDVTVMSYGPGFEIEARILRVKNRSQLAWIGFASQHAGSPNVPTLDAAAFEALRTSGQRVPTFEAATRHVIEGELEGADDVAEMWVKICLDEAGAITMIDPYAPRSYPVMEAFLAVAGSWTFRPFVHAGKARAACSMVRMAYPPAKATPVETLPLPPPPSTSVRPPVTLAQRKFAKLMEGKRIAGTRGIGPDEETQLEIKSYRTHEITGRFRLCLDTKGSVESVLPIQSTGFPAYDVRLMAGMSAWKYSPYTINGEAVPVCTMIVFIYHQR